jgi:aromatic-L-amino-acid decarboxylase
VRWFADIVGYPETAGGILTTGGSLATFSALVTARRERLSDDFLSGVLYASDQTHHSIAKAAMLAGFPEKNVRSIPSDATYRLRLDALAAAVSEDRAAGRRPFFVTGNAGTTNTGAVDDLGALADFCSREGLWFHVDAAYGGFFLLTEAGRRALEGISRADSVVLDPHKGLFLPYGTGSLLVRDAGALRRAHALSADYMPVMQEDPDLVDFNLISPELSREWRGLRVWLPIAMHGIGAFRRNLEEKLELTRWATEELRTIPGVEIVAEPQLSIVAFRMAPPNLDAEAVNALNRRFLAAINARKRVYLTGTMLGNRFALRICVLSFRTHLDRMREGMEDIREAATEVRGTS